VEAALSKRSPFGSGSWSEFFDEVEADIRLPSDDGEKTLTELLDVLTNAKTPEARARAMNVINTGLGGYFAKYAAQSLYVVAGEMAVERRERGYKNPMDARNKSNRIPDAVVDALHEAVMTTAGPLARRYYALKAKLLGVEKLPWSERNAPMPFVDSTIIPFNENRPRGISKFQPNARGTRQRFRRHAPHRCTRRERAAVGGIQQFGNTSGKSSDLIRLSQLSRIEQRRDDPRARAWAWRARHARWRGTGTAHGAGADRVRRNGVGVRRNDHI
jgi:hypothetical protein